MSTAGNCKNMCGLGLGLFCWGFLMSANGTMTNLLKHSYHPLIILITAFHLTSLTSSGLWFRWKR